MSTSSNIEHKLTQLKLSRIREVYPSWIAQAEQHQLGYAEFLDELLSEELVGRQENQIRRKLKAAGFPYAATLESFDFSLRLELKRAVMVRFFDSAFIEKAGALLLIRPSGTGKTHLAVALGTKMVQLGYSVHFLTVQQLANAVLAAATRVEVERVLRPLIRCDLLILDEFGYRSVDPQIGPALYELVSARYTHRATVITSNKSLASWGEVVGGDTALMMAILDRLAAPWRGVLSARFVTSHARQGASCAGGEQCRFTLHATRGASCRGGDGCCVTFFRKGGEKMSEKTPRVWEVQGYDTERGRRAILSDPAAPGPDIVVDSPAWFVWLESPTTTSFSYPLFDPAAGYIMGFMTVRKEQWKRGTSYWSVYRRCQGRVQRVYLGRSVTITDARLNAIATSLRLTAEHRPSMIEPEPGSDGK